MLCPKIAVWTSAINDDFDGSSIRCKARTNCIALMSLPALSQILETHSAEITPNFYLVTNLVDRIALSGVVNEI